MVQRGTNIMLDRRGCLVEDQYLHVGLYASICLPCRIQMWTLHEHRTVHPWLRRQSRWTIVVGIATSLSSQVTFYGNRYICSCVSIFVILFACFNVSIITISHRSILSLFSLLSISPLPPVHRFCELPRDPHSPKQIGTERAFGFFLERAHVDEEFVPQHIQFPGLRLLDTWAFIVVSFELWFAYTFLGGNIALYIAFTSGWLSQTISLWFNIANHPIVKPSIDPNEKNLSKKVSSQCTASDDQAVMEPGIWYIPFYLLDAIVPMFSWLAMEDQHEHHHNHGNLAKRSPYDVAYWTFVKPLEMVGLVWNVVVK